MKNIKCVLVGDEAVGKTSLQITYTTRAFPDKYVPMSDTTTIEIVVDGSPYTLDLWDPNADRLRVLSYPNTDIFLACFAINSKQSLDDIRSLWMPEIQHHVPGVPVMLVGTKSDLRKDCPETQFVGDREISELVEELGIVGFVECSSRHQEGVNKVFEEAVRNALVGIRRRRKERRGGCNVV